MMFALFIVSDLSKDGRLFILLSRSNENEPYSDVPFLYKCMWLMYNSYINKCKTQRELMHE